MISNIGICNLGLTFLGATPINSFNDNSKNARACNRVYDFCRKAAIREHPWNFAVKYQQLALLSHTPPNTKWAYAYSHPAHCERVWGLTNETDEWELVSDGSSNMIYANTETPICKYAVDITDVTLYDPLFVQMFAASIAVSIASSIAMSKKMAEMMNLYQFFLERAELGDAQEGYLAPDTSNPFVDAR